MRTTVAIDDDVLLAAKAIATSRGKSLGRVLSDLARKSLYPEPSPPQRYRNGIPLLPITNPDAVITLEIVNALRDEAP